ncbi:MAG: hypothetical protein AAB954_02575 [Patescibacteria group bacterium]|nr:hypothetical protein [Candidatus Woesebacteria bacterium]
MPKAKATSTPLVKSKLEPALGFRTPSFFRGSRFSGKPNFQSPKFNPTQFHTQHKGGS